MCFKVCIFFLAIFHISSSQDSDEKFFFEKVLHTEVINLNPPLIDQLTDKAEKILVLKKSPLPIADAQKTVEERSPLKIVFLGKVKIFHTRVDKLIKIRSSH
jgi:hypothetical protein